MMARMWAVMDGGVGPRVRKLVGVPEVWTEVWVQDSEVDNGRVRTGGQNVGRMVRMD